MKLYKNLSSALKDRDEVRALKVSLSGEFPSGIFDLPNLVELHLEGACRGLPDLKGKFPQLKTISIKFDGFSGDVASLFALPQLSNLKIIETSLKHFLLPLGVVPAPIQFLTLKGCGISQLPLDFSMLQNLQELSLAGNELDALPVSFHELTALRRLNLDQNNFSRFPDVIKRMPGLKQLSIDGNSFSDEEKERIQREYHLWPA